MDAVSVHIDTLVVEKVWSMDTAVAWQLVCRQRRGPDGWLGLLVG